jgi:hypothetical protein
MGKTTQEDQLSLLPSPELARSLAVISAYSQILEAHSEDFYKRLVTWAIAALVKGGAAPEWMTWIDRLVASKATPKQKWWLLRQFLPEPALHALARHLDAQVQRISEARRENADAPIDHT